MKQAYLPAKNWTARKREIFEKIVAIVEDYQEQGYRMTLRQLYYQLVSKDVIPNVASEYAKLSTLLTEARMYGLVDWDFIEDRVRRPKKVAQWDKEHHYRNAVAAKIDELTRFCTKCGADTRQNLFRHINGDQVLCADCWVKT